MKHAALILMAAFTLSCAGRTIPADGPLDRAAEGIDVLMALCEMDLKSAKKVIVDNEIIKNLSHLQLMNSGGDKYYLLERENISKMILSVTEGIYSDFILINAKGTVIYTMNNDDIFGKNVRTTLAGSPLKTCFDDTKGLYYGGLVVPFKGGLKETLLPAISIAGGERSSGFFILQIGKDTIRKFVHPGVRILDSRGHVLVSHASGEEGTVYTSFPAIGTGGGAERSRPYVRANLEWILVRETR